MIMSFIFAVDSYLCFFPGDPNIFVNVRFEQIIFTVSLLTFN